MKRGLVFDTGPIISLTINNLLWLLEPLKKAFNGNFYITRGVYDELITRPLETKKYKFEALQVLPYISRGTLTHLADDELIQNKTNQLLELMNKCFLVNNTPLKIVHYAEIETVATALLLGHNTVVIDERTTRKYIEDPFSLKKTLERKLGNKVTVDRYCLKQVKNEIEKLKVIRSFELVIMAYELGLLDRYILNEERKLISDLDHAVLEGALWGIKLNGCSVREEDIKGALNLVKHR